MADQLTFRFDLDDAWTLKVGGTYTYDGETSPQQGEKFGTSSAQIVSAVGGVEWQATPRVDLYLDVSGSPLASQRFGATLTPYAVQVENASSSVGTLLGVTYEIGGTEFLGAVIGATALDVSAGWTLITTHQRVDAAVDPINGAPVSGAALMAICRAYPNTRGCKRLEPFLKGGSDNLNQFVFSLAALQPLGSSTDLGLSASVYVYDQDPLAASFFTTSVQQLTSLGGGFPLAPQRWSVSPTLEQRLGSWSIGPWYQFLQYASDYGQAHVAGLRVSLKLGTDWTVWLTGSLQWDLLNDPPPSTGTSLLTSGRVALGFRARF
jgi:hypothetical protein